ncbi:MAG: sugar ABC transporter permease, partial [Clostridiaceae bacterium]|nr:sugar ABC transporter permease [Clostridiaceae bacterium]
MRINRRLFHIRDITQKSKSRYLWDRNKYGYLFLLPWLVGIFAFTFYPIISSLYYSFTNYNLFTDPDWIGLKNYKNILFENARVVKALKVTGVYVLLDVPLQLLTALALALLLNKGIRGLPFFRAMFYIPSLLGGSVAISVLWRQIFGQAGAINKILIELGLTTATEAISWVSNPNTSIYTLIILHMWQFGSPMIIYLAGLKQIPQELYESAAIDGARKWKTFLHITLPLLTPIIFFNLIMQVISAFQAFTPAFIIGGGRGGGPLDSLLFYTLYLYFVGFTEFRMGYASAMAWLLLIIIVIVTGLLFVSSRKWVHY